MHFNNLITRRRKTEPKSVHVLRACIKTFLLAFLVAYIIFMINEVIHDVPVIHISEEDADEMPFPDMGFMSKFSFNVECRFISVIGATTGDYSCNNSLVQPQRINYDNSDVYFGYFFNNNNLKYTADPRFTNSVIEIDIFSDTSANIITFSAIDSEYNPFKSQDNTINIEIPMLGLINKLLNSYVIINNQYSYIELARHKRKKIRRGIRDILFGFPSYDVQPFIVSNLLSMPLTDEQRTRPDAYLSKIGLNIKNFQIQVETERRTRSLLNVVGLVGGAWSISMVLYTLLFGANLFRPWGCTQAYCCGYRTYNKFKNTLPVLPLVNSSSLLTKPNPSLQDITELQDRLNSLEMFLMEYVVDVKYLEKSEKMDQKLDDGK